MLHSRSTGTLPRTARPQCGAHMHERRTPCCLVQRPATMQDSQRRADASAAPLPRQSILSTYPTSLAPNGLRQVPQSKELAAFPCCGFLHCVKSMSGSVSHGFACWKKRVNVLCRRIHGIGCAPGALCSTMAMAQPVTAQSLDPPSWAVQSTSEITLCDYSPWPPSCISSMLCTRN